MTINLSDLTVKIFADGANMAMIEKLAKNPSISGFTTNPTLMRKDGIEDYVAFAKKMLTVVGERPVSFEVFSDEFGEMKAQAIEIASWGTNVFVKIPITNTRGEPSTPLIKDLAVRGIKVNVTAIMTLNQVRAVTDALQSQVPSVVSIFAGRIADTGVDPVPLMQEPLDILSTKPAAELLWASPRELLNIFQANDIGCQIITVTHELLNKLSGVGKDLNTFSLETVEMFHNDATAAGYNIKTKLDV